MFVSEYSHQIDAKSRMRMPAQFKSEFDGKYAFVIRQESILSVYPVSEIDRLKEYLDKVSTFDIEAENDIAEYLSSFRVVEEDPQGRIVVPKEFREEIGLGKDIVIYAAGDHVNITSAAHRKEMKAANKKGDLLKRLNERYKDV